jgi:peptidyl-prolyl cis-trans isomerase C
MKSLRSISRQLRASLLSACLAVTPFSTALAVDGVLMQGGGVQVTTQDVLQELAGQGETLRAQLFADQGLDKQPEIQQQLQTLRDNLLAQAMVHDISAAATPQADAVERLARASYKAEPERFNAPQRTHARHILVRGTDEAAHQQALQLLQQIKDGASFEALAKAHSADPGSARKGGDLGSFTAGKMVPAFEQAVDALRNPGDLSEPVKTQFGWHIIRLEQRVPAKARSYDEARDELYAEIIGKAQKQAQQQAIQRLRAQAQGDEALLQAFVAAEKTKLPAVDFSKIPAK